MKKVIKDLSVFYMLVYRRTNAGWAITKLGVTLWDRQPRDCELILLRHLRR